MAIRQDIGPLFTDFFEVTMAQSMLGQRNVGHGGPTRCLSGCAR